MRGLGAGGRRSSNGNGEDRGFGEVGEGYGAS